MICYEACKFSFIDILVFCEPLSYVSFVTISDLTYSTVMCYEDCKYPFIDTLASCVPF